MLIGLTQVSCGGCDIGCPRGFGISIVGKGYVVLPAGHYVITVATGAETAEFTCDWSSTPNCTGGTAGITLSGYIIGFSSEPLIATVTVSRDGTLVASGTFTDFVSSDFLASGNDSCSCLSRGGTVEVPP